MINMDQRAQISIEYILLVAIVLLVVIVFALIITNQNEQNNVATAAQLGASNAVANTIFTNTSQYPVKVTYVDMTNSTNGTDINIVIHFSGPVSNQSNVINNISSSLVAAGYSNITLSSGSLNLITSTGTGIRHNYTITLS
jgi:uncharacterized protein (UPF0333 family)